MSHYLCSCCQKPESEHKLKQNKNRKAVRYCSEQCQKTNWADHKEICRAISESSSRAKSQNREKGLGDGEDENLYVSHIIPKQQAPVTKLVGRNCTVRCQLNEAETEVLWDTEAQVFITLLTFK